MSEPPDERKQPRPSGAGRKSYRTPKLERLGTLTEITATIDGPGQKGDGGHPGSINKTS